MAGTERNQGLFLAFVFLGACLGAVVGSVFPGFAIGLGFLGTIFMNALKMMVLPLIATSLIVGIQQFKDTRSFGTLGLKTVVYYMITTAIAVVIGIVLVNLLKPGAGYGAFLGEIPERILQKGNHTFVDVLVGLVHPNIFQAASDFKILPIIVATLMFAVALLSLGERGHEIMRHFGTLNDAILKIIEVIIYFTPVGVFSLIAYRIGVAGGGDAVWDLLSQLAKYCGVVIAGLFLHAFVVLPLLYLFLVRKNPLTYLGNLAKALMTAFATASSSATLPVTMQCVSNNAGVSKKTSGFVLPLGATINMDGTALYEAVAAIFIAQAYQVDLSFGQMVVVFLTATLAAIGAAGIPEAGLVTMIMVLQAVGLPAEGIGLILAVDWFLDRCRTTVNVWGDAVGAAVLDREDDQNIQA